MKNKQITDQEKEYFSKVEPIGKKVIIKRELLSKNNIILAGSTSKYKPMGTVLAVGPECKVIKVGDKVAWSSMTICEVLYVEELKDNPDTEGNYVTTSEDYLAYKLK